MTNNKYIPAVAIILIAIVAVFINVSNKKTEITPAAPKMEKTMTTQTVNESLENKNTPDTGGPKNMQDYTGEVLAGTTTKLLSFNQSDYELALSENKTIVLYFYANWCPICREEFPKMQAAFNELEAENVIGFRVNFNDNETDSNEKSLARTHGIAYQHTKVVIQDGKQILKSPETWEKDRYIELISQY